MIEAKIRRKLGEPTEEQSEDEHAEDRLQDDPQNADRSLFVTDLDVAPNEEIEEFSVGPDFAEAKLEEAAGRLDAESDGGAGVERKSSGFWRCGERSHALRVRSPRR